MSVTPSQQAQFAAAIAHIKKSGINPVSFESWFARLKLFSVTNEAVIIEVDDTFALSHLKGRYMSLLYTQIAIAFDRTYEIELYSSEEIERQMRHINNSMLNPKYKFENFVVGPSNNFAYAASLAVAEEPGGTYNPLYLYGGVGLGKTHLMNAIGNYITEADPYSHVLYITSETFTNQLIDAILKKKGTAEIRAKMRNVDVLLVDDIQFLARTTATQEEFFHTFNDLFLKGKQIIISSDRPPKDIPTIEERLRSRFESGLTIDIQKPDFETRVAILRKKAEEEDLIAPDDVIEFIASRVDSNIRELEGSLIRINAQSDLMEKPITLEFAESSLSELISNRDVRTITPKLINEIVAKKYGVEEADLVSRKKNREIALPRQIAMYIIREMSALSTNAIGKAFGRDHTTVMYACDKIAENMRRDMAFRKTVNELMEHARSR